MAKKEKKKISKAAQSLAKKSQDGKPEPETQQLNKEEAFNKAKQRHAAGDLQTAATLYATILKADENNVEVLFRLGTALAQMNDLERAAKLLLRATEIQPNFPEAYNNLGNIYDTVNMYDDAQRYYTKAVKQNPNYLDAIFNLACNYKKTFKSDEAIECFEKLLKIKQDDIRSMMELAPLKLGYGYLEEAQELWQKIYDATGDEGMRMSKEFALPIILPDKQAILKLREDYEKTIDKVLSENIRIERPEKSFKRTSFRLAFHGMNNKEIMHKLGKMYEHISPHLNFTAKHCNDENYYPKKDGKLRIGFVSRYFHTHSVSMCYNGIIEDLAEDKNYEVFLISTEAVAIVDEKLEKLEKKVSGKLAVPGDIGAAHEMIEELELDVIIYTEIGMDNMAYCLAFARLAPIQALLAGHPDTSGISNVDYYLSSSIIEPENNQEHYSEELVLFSDIPHRISRPETPDFMMERKDLGLPEGKNLYVCPMKIQKLHPDFDKAMDDILSKDKDGIIVLFKEYPEGDLTNQLQARLKRTISEKNFGRIMMVSWANTDTFPHYLRQANIVLDPFHFGGGSTIYIIFSNGAPCVTWPGELVTGRTAYSRYKLMGIEGLVAKDWDDYVDIAVKVANDSDLREEYSKKILDKVDLLFENERVIEEIKDWVDESASKNRLIG